MNIYSVWTMNGIVEVKADKILRVDRMDKPIRIYFLAKGECVAEFYVEHVCGWVKREDNETES